MLNANWKRRQGSWKQPQDRPHDQGHRKQLHCLQHASIRAFLSNLPLRQFLTPISFHSNTTSLWPLPSLQNCLEISNSFPPPNKMKCPAATPKPACPLPAAVGTDNEAREPNEFFKKLLSLSGKNTQDFV